jgi:2-oxoglutarate dehydrogenase E2 component (dihydrolipoamide succinyltransferase)
MHVDFVMPDLGLRRGDAWVSVWLVDVGAPVLAGESLLEVAADGVTIDLPAPAEGVLQRILVSEDEPLAVGRRLAVIATGDDAPQSKAT